MFDININIFNIDKYEFVVGWIISIHNWLFTIPPTVI